MGGHETATAANGARAYEAVTSDARLPVRPPDRDRPPSSVIPSRRTPRLLRRPPNGHGSRCANSPARRRGTAGDPCSAARPLPKPRARRSAVLSAVVVMVTTSEGKAGSSTLGPVPAIALDPGRVTAKCRRRRDRHERRPAVCIYTRPWKEWCGGGRRGWPRGLAELAEAPAGVRMAGRCRGATRPDRRRGRPPSVRRAFVESDRAVPASKRRGCRHGCGRLGSALGRARLAARLDPCDESPPKAPRRLDGCGDRRGSQKRARCRDSARLPPLPGGATRPGAASPRVVRRVCRDGGFASVGRRRVAGRRT